MLRTAGPDVYDQWVSHDIPFNDESVQNAAEIFGQVMFGDGYVLGGADQTPAIAFGDAPGPMFQDPPGCWLHRQASFINAFFPPEAEAGVDYDWFPFPPIDQEGTLIAGEFAVAFRNAPEIQDFLERFSSQELQCAQGGETGVVPALAQHRGRPRLLRQRDPRPVVGGHHGSAGGWHRPVRRLRPDADRGRRRKLLDGDDGLHVAWPGLGHAGPRRHRGELAAVARPVPLAR